MRRTKIIRVVADLDGSEWECRLGELAECGIWCWQGWPAGQIRGKGGVGGPSWVLTEDLAAWMSTNAVRYHVHMRTAGFPFGRTAARRMRRTLGLTRLSDRLRWWSDREADLLTLTREEFGRRHGYTADTVTLWARRLGHSPREHADGWYLQPRNLAVLTSGTLPLSYMADRYSLSIRTIHQVRHTIKTVHGITVVDRRGLRSRP